MSFRAIDNGGFLCGSTEGLVMWVVAAALVGGSRTVSAQADLQRDSTLRSRTAYEVMTESAAAGLAGAPGLNPGDIRLTQLRELGGGLNLWRASVDAHTSGQDYLMAWDGEMLRLGGFARPQICAVAARLGLRAYTQVEIWAAAKLLAELVDPEGAIDIVLVGDQTTDSATANLIARWSDRRPSWWPSDTVLLADSRGSRVAILTVLTYRPKGSAPRWYPVVHAFAFDNAGALVGWSFRVGEHLGRK